MFYYSKGTPRFKGFNRDYTQPMRWVVLPHPGVFGKPLPNDPAWRNQVAIFLN